MKQAIVRPIILLLLGACAGNPALRLPTISPSLHDKLRGAQYALDSAVAAGAAPGAVLAVSHHGEIAFAVSGHLGVHDSTPTTPRTLYDLASLTKVVALTTLSMMAVEEGKLDLDATVVSYLPDFARGTGEKGQVTVRDLLLHDSGLPAGRPLWRETFVRNGAILRTVTSNLVTAPGARMVYSDLGAITLTAIIEKLYHKRVDNLFRERVTKPLELDRMRYLPPKSWRKSIAPTEVDPWRKREVRGEVHDENAAWMDGVSGHAGLFSDAENLLRFGEWALAGAQGKQVTGVLQPPKSFASWTLRQDHPTGSSRAIGWDTPSGNASSAGRLMSARSFGHTGFTGTSIWIDPEHDVVIVLLTNRVNPTRTTPAFGNIRGVMADAVMRGLGYSTPR